MKLKLDCLQSNFKTFKNFNQGDLCVYHSIVQILNVAVSRATISGYSCYRIETVQVREWTESGMKKRGAPFGLRPCKIWIRQK